MSQAPYMPVFTDALLGDTIHLTAEEFGSYCLILFATWNNGAVPLPDDDARLCLVVRCSLYKWRRLRPVLVKFFNIDDGTWRQKRLEKEWRRTLRIIAAQRANAAKSGSGRKTAIRSQSFCEVASSKILPNELKSLKTDVEMVQQPKPRPKGEAKEEEESKILEGDRGVAALPSAEPASVPEPEPAETAADPPTAEQIAEVDALVERAVAAARGGVPKGIRDAVAYGAAVKDNKFTALVKNLNVWAGTALDGEARFAAWEVLAAAERAGARAGMTRATRRDFDRLDRMHRATGPPDDMAQAA